MKFTKYLDITNNIKLLYNKSLNINVACAIRSMRGLLGNVVVTVGGIGRWTTRKKCNWRRLGQSIAKMSTVVARHHFEKKSSKRMWKAQRTTDGVCAKNKASLSEHTSILNFKNEGRQFDGYVGVQKTCFWPFWPFLACFLKLPL